MISIVSYLFEVLGDPKWTDRLVRRSNEYNKASNIPQVHNSTAGKLYAMSVRAAALATKNRHKEGTFSQIKHGLLNDRPTAHNPNSNMAYQSATDALYPKRVEARVQNAKALLPKSLQK
jgi:hypothetical protein